MLSLSMCVCVCIYSSCFVLWAEFILFYDKNRDISFLKTKCVEGQRKISELNGEKIGDLNIMELQTLLQTQKVCCIAWYCIVLYGQCCLCCFILCVFVARYGENAGSTECIWGVSRPYQTVL